MTTEEIHDSPVGWVSEHIASYTASGGRNGHVLQGRPTLLITTRGRRSGLLRRTGATYLPTASGYLVADSNGGSDDTPAWSLNLAADPRVQLQVGPEHLDARARFLHGAERAEAWRQLVAFDPLYAQLQDRTERAINVIALEPTSNTDSVR